MMTFPLILRRTESAAAPAAWLIPGADVETWIAEISRWGVAMDGLRLYLLPRSIQDRRPLGVLVTGVESLAPNRACRAQPYRLLAGRLYIPTDAELIPAISETELHSVLVWHVQILHPSAGLVGCRRDEGLRISDLLLPPRRFDGDWDHAARTTVYAPRLLSIEAEMPPTIETLLEEGRDGIGSQSPEELAPNDDESKLDEILARAGRPGLKFMKWIMSGGASGSAGAGWKNNLEKWAAQKLQRIDEALEAARFRELQRLQKLFESNPDEALKFAIPLYGAGSRGLATPGRKLSDRTPDFNIGRISGGRPADPWAIPAQTQQNLTAQYRAAANRELHLRRYRRAAYVFAELLGDFSAAANALEQGRYFREAATLYRDRLKNPAAAAKCLKQGGLLLEAVVIYEELREWEEAGDLYTVVDRHDDAKRCYRRAFDVAVDRNVLDAARLLETKLGAPDEALDILIFQWPGSKNAAECLSAHFNLLEKLNRDDQTLSRIATLRDQPLPDERVQPLAEILSSLATKHRAPVVRTLAADATRVVVGRRLAHVDGPEAKSLVMAVTRLCPGDTLLVRDGSRFLGRLSKTIKLSPTGGKPKLVAEFHLPGNIVLSSAVSTGDTLFAIGRENRIGTVIYRAKWDGKSEKMNWMDGLLDPGLCALEPGPHARSLLLIPLGREQHISVYDSFRPTEGFPEPCRVGIPPWLPDETILGSGQDEHGQIWISQVGDGHGPNAFLNVFSIETGQLLSTRGPLETESTMDGQFVANLTPVVARTGHVFLITGQSLWHLARNDAAKSISLPRKCVHAIGSPQFTRVRLAAAFDVGGIVLWDEGTQHSFGEGMNEPKIGFTRSGFLVAADAGEARVYRTDGLTIAHHCTFPMNGMKPLAVCAAAKLNEIGIVGVDGLVRVFEISPRR